MSVSRFSVRRTGRLEHFAATAAATELKTLLVSFPPKPPPIRFILTTTRAIRFKASSQQIHGE